VGYTSLVESHAQRTEEVRSTLQETFDVLAATVIDHGGIVEKFIGDAVCVLFGAPAVHEDDPERACTCALAMADAVARLNRDRQAKSSEGMRPLELRIGLSTGEVVGGTADQAGKEQYSVTGDAVNTASRLQTAAEPGQILVGAATERLTRAAFDFTPAGDIRLKGKRALVAAFVLRGRRQADDRPGADLINRRRELERLRYCLEQAAQAEPQLVEVVGDAGVGKSRLIDAFVDEAAAGAFVCLGSCPPMAVSSLYPFRSIAANLLQAVNDELEEDPSLAPAIEVIGEVATGAAITAAGAPDEVMSSAIITLVDALGKIRPALVLVENIHRADPDSLQVLQRLILRASREPLMLGWTRRTGEDAVVHGDSTASFTRISLRPLLDLDAQELMLQYLGSVEVPDRVKHMIVDRSGGNPLYVEAMVRMFLEDTELLDRSETEALEIPTTVQGLIQARLDSLPEPQRLVAQEAAVAGREFDARLLQTVDLFGLEVLPALEALARRGMIEHVGASTYRFRHVLTQEVCYATMLQGLRAELHREIADSIPEMFPDRVSELAPARADHYAKAGDTDRAVEVLVEAGGGEPRA